MTLLLTTHHLQILQTDAQQAYPHEGCGLLLGVFDPVIDQRTLTEIRLLANAWEPELVADLAELSAPGIATPTKSRRYWIDPKDMLAAQRDARERGLSIIGVYHSHPNHVAVPSECDRTLAWSDYSYLIVSVQNGSAVDLQCWQLDAQHQFQSEPMTITEGGAHVAPKRIKSLSA